MNNAHNNTKIKPIQTRKFSPKERHQVLRNAQSQMYKNPMNEKVINYIMRDLYRLLKENENDSIVHVTLAKIFFEKKEYKKALIHFNIAHRQRPDLPSAIYGIYKSSVMLGYHENAFEFLTKYKEKTNSNTDLAESLLNVIINKNTDSKITDNKKLFTMEIKDEELQETYDKLIEAFNSGDYEQAVLLADECEIICRIKSIYIEFNTIAKLLKAAQEIKNNISQDEEVYNYQLLKEALLTDEHYKVIVLLNRINKKNIKDHITFYNAIRYLIKKEYISEAKKIIASIPLYTEKLEPQLLLKDCELKKQIVSYDDRMKKIFEDNLLHGKDFFIEGQYEDAYDTFLAGYYITQSPIFLYYMGKTLYKAEKFKEAEEVLLEYVKVGGVKSAKAYIYLRNISRYLHNTKKEKQYAIKGNNIMRTFYPEYNIMPTTKINKEEDDTLKLYLQSRRKHEFDDLFDIEEQ